MTRSTRSTWNFATITAFSVVSMVVGLVAVPSLLTHLGAARLGAARAVLDWTGYLGLLEMGIGGALAPLLARSLATEDRDGVRDMLAAGFRGYFRIAIATVVGGLVLASLITHLLKVESTYQHDLTIAMLVAVVPALLIPLSPLRALAEADQRGYIVNLLLIAQSLVITGVAVLLAKWGWGITGQSIAVAIGAFVFTSLLVADAWTRRRTMMPDRSTRASDHAFRSLRQLSGAALVLNVCGRVGLLTDNIIIGWTLSAGAIVPFYMTQRLAQIAQGQLQAIGTATWAGLANMHAQAEHALFRERFIELSRLVVLLGLMGLLPIVAYNSAFVSLWVGDAQYGGFTLTALAALNALLLSLASLWGWAFGGTGRLDRLVPLGVASASLNLLISVGATWWLSVHDPGRALLGPVVGTTAAYTLLNIPCLPFLLRTHFGVPVGALLRAVFVPLVIGLPYGAALLWLSIHYPPATWWMLAVEMSTAAMAFGAMSWLTLLTAEERTRWMLRITLAIRPKATGSAGSVEKLGVRPLWRRALGV